MKEERERPSQKVVAINEPWLAKNAKGCALERQNDGGNGQFHQPRGGYLSLRRPLPYVHRPQS